MTGYADVVERATRLYAQDQKEPPRNHSRLGGRARQRVGWARQSELIFDDIGFAYPIRPDV